MAVPVFVGAGDGVAILTGTATVSKTGATAGNLLVIHLVTRGTTEDWSFPAFGTVVNIERVDGSDNLIEAIVTSGNIGATSKHAFFTGRVMANGTVSADATVGPSGEDLFIRIYEFSGASLGKTLAAVFEGTNTTWSSSTGTSASVGDAGIPTNGTDRLACNFVGLDANLAIGNFTGETGGDWTEALAEFGSASGATATLQLQTAAMASGGTIDGGTTAITSAGWGVLGTGIIPASAAILRPAMVV